MDFKKDVKMRKIPVIPAKEKQIRLIIDSDCKNEIDDQWAIALAILSPGRFKIEGFVGANFDNQRGGSDSVEKSVKEIKKVLQLAGMEGRWPVKYGSDPMQYRFQPSESEGVDFIIEKAMASSPDDPLWIVGLGSATNIASAVLKEPEIIDKIIVFWHFRTRWPEKCYNFNVFGDIRAARIVFHSPLSFVLFDTGTYLNCPMEESKKNVYPYGQLGKYLHEYRYTDDWFMSADKGFFDLGDIAALYDPALACWEETNCPEVDWDLDYVFNNKYGKILRCYHIDRDRTFALLYEKLKKAAQS